MVWVGEATACLYGICEAAILADGYATGRWIYSNREDLVLRARSEFSEEVGEISDKKKHRGHILLYGKGVISVLFFWLFF